ncbi:MAG: hypothetical protein U0792_24950 [Gemmataceae bacterium]
MLARKPEHLGELYSPIGDMVFGPKPTTVGADDRMNIDLTYRWLADLRRSLMSFARSGLARRRSTRR